MKLNIDYKCFNIVKFVFNDATDCFDIIICFIVLIMN